jgi:lysophospholipase L1-like esterase
MAGLGDSMTQAMNCDGVHFGDQPWYSWSTGDSSTVQSHYYRIRHQNPLISGHNYNDAASGTRMAFLNGQAQTAVSQHVEYVTILMGANDVCTSSEATMTPVATFRTQFQTAMDTLTQGTEGQARRIFVASIPDIYQLWYILHDNSDARDRWAVGICQSLLANPLSDDPADVTRRNNVRQRNIDFNTQLSEVCALYPQCRFDGNGVFNGALEVSDVATMDYFHPSITGQAKIASGTWETTYDFPTPVGGVAELPDVSDSSDPDYVVVAVLAAAALVALGAGGWYARRRWLG